VLSYDDALFLPSVRAMEEHKSVGTNTQLGHGILWVCAMQVADVNDVGTAATVCILPSVSPPHRFAHMLASIYAFIIPQGVTPCG
jgi:hypothetical protein